ncbi:MAG: hypothetical protein GVY04_19500 [Cyanobacteria bacterium]|jgi:hypothetical protein|nr:hypothetical protein [Cyanobacteria bacterium GSL.Bin1]
MANNFLKDDQLNQKKADSLSSFLTLKEKLYTIIPFGWGALTLFLAGGTDRSISSFYRFLSFGLGSAGISILTLVNSSLIQVLANILLILGINLFVLSNDLFNEKVDKNLTIHFLNAGYLGLALYLYVMTLYPMWFQDLWPMIVVSAPQSALMLTLCLFCQNIGYFILGNLVFGASSVANWFNSRKNVLNLEFIKPNQISKVNLLFFTLIIMGSISRLIEIFLGGSILYGAVNVIPTSISSFLAQFSVLYPIGWLYGSAKILSPQEKTNKLIKSITFVLISFELVFQFFSGSKGRFFTQIIIPLSAVYLLVKKKVSVQFVIIGFGLAFTSWLVLYPVLVVYREALFESYQLFGSSFSLIDNMNFAFQTMLNFSWNDYLDVVMDPLNKLGLAEQNLALTSIIHNDLRLPGTGENLWERLMFFWLPRFLWPAKPTNLSANLIGRLTGRVNPEDYTTSVLTTGPGEVFIYYGFAGSLLMIIAGLVFRGTNDLISPFLKFSQLKVATFIVFVGLVDGIISGNFEEAITGILLQLGLLYFIVWLFKKITT